jgi:hypothetical protein
VSPAEPIVEKLVIPNHGAYNKKLSTRKNKRNFVPSLYCLLAKQNTQVPKKADQDHFLMKSLFCAGIFIGLSIFLILF